ncbi:energy-coupling factor ABC transporter substrate-binding protein [Chloroflexia bacterium SDU3-3]|nr:energy-coupling factor ABC transporter substrate-binding protein [Chloroflexia bacterium SDU3-3]
MTATPQPFRRGTVLALLVAVLALAVLPLLIIRGSEFGGSDGAAEQAIAEVAPHYTPWAEPLWSPPGGETESLLFALQAAIGAATIGYFFGLKRGQRMAREDANTTKTQSLEERGEKVG